MDFWKRQLSIFLIIGSIKYKYVMELSIVSLH